MKNHLFVFFAFLLCISCHQENNLKDQQLDVAVIPVPKELILGDKALILSAESKIYTPNERLEPLLSLFANELKTLTKIDLTTSTSELADVSFEIDTTLVNDGYRIHIENRIDVTAGSYQAAAMARTTLLQMAHVEGKELLFPQVQLYDHPDAQYRGLMIDLARNWHSMETVKKLIDLASYYKTNYLQLHFTDDQSYTLPSKKYPQLPTSNRHYSFADLQELESYSQRRGVTIIPEIDIPGHAKSLVTAYPNLFGIKDHVENPYIINMGKEEVYTALDALIGEIVPVFKSTPYFHIGGDEARFSKVMEDPHIQSYMKAHNLGNEDVHELYRHFLVRVNEIVKKYGKQTCVWEGFTRQGQVEIPKDMIVFEFETNRYLPNELIEDGYTVVNTSWKPIYVVNEKKWEPKTIYGWDMWRWENWWSKAPSIVPIQVEESPLVIGAQMCTWEQPQEIEFTSLRKRLPVMNERIWNTKKNIPYEEYMQYLDSTDAKLSLLADDHQQDSLLIGHNHVEPEN